MRRTLSLLGLFVLLVGGAWLWVIRHPEIAPASGVELTDAPADLITQGELLATVGGCESCHGEDLAGGVPLPTPFGTIYSTNITPEAQTGIGAWPAEAFRRAMRYGIDRQGSYLYPAFPYDYYTKLTDADIDAIYAYLMSRPPITRTDTPNELSFPYNIRWAMAGWNLLFLDPGPFIDNPNRDADIDRGAYLAEGLGHCAACHSPRNRFGARDTARDYTGGWAEGWYSPALGTGSPAPVPWNSDSLINYFYDGWDEDHGIAAGPMKEVVENLSVLPEEDVQALAAYALSLGEKPGGQGDAARAFAEAAALQVGEPPPDYDDATLRRGHALFVERCANCHRAGSEAVPLALATEVSGPEPANFLRVVIEGVTPTENAYFVRPMPGFAQLTDEELHDLAVFVRSRFSQATPWSGIRDAIAGAR